MAQKAPNRVARTMAGAMVVALSVLLFACSGAHTGAATTVPLPPIAQLEGIVRSALPVTMGLPTPCDDGASGQQGIYTLHCGSGPDTYSFLVNVATLTASPADQLTATAIQNNRLVDCTTFKLCSN